MLWGPSENTMVYNSLEHWVPNTWQVLGTHRSTFHGHECTEGGRGGRMTVCQEAARKQKKRESNRRRETEREREREKVLNSVWLLVSTAVWLGSTTCLMFYSMCQAYALRHSCRPHDNNWRWISESHAVGLFCAVEEEERICGVEVRDFKGWK